MNLENHKLRPMQELDRSFELEKCLNVIENTKFSLSKILLELESMQQHPEALVERACSIMDSLRAVNSRLSAVDDFRHYRQVRSNK